MSDPLANVRRLIADALAAWADPNNRIRPCRGVWLRNSAVGSCDCCLLTAAHIGRNGRTPRLVETANDVVIQTAREEYGLSDQEIDALIMGFDHLQEDTNGFLAEVYRLAQAARKEALGV